MTYLQVYEMDTQYCEWVVATFYQDPTSTTALKNFARWLIPRMERDGVIGQMPRPPSRANPSTPKGGKGASSSWQTSTRTAVPVNTKASYASSSAGYSTPMASAPSTAKTSPGTPLRRVPGTPMSSAPGTPMPENKARVYATAHSKAKASPTTPLLPEQETEEELIAHDPMPQWDGEESTWSTWLEAVHERKMAQKIQADWM